MKTKKTVLKLNIKPSLIILLLLVLGIIGCSKDDKPTNQAPEAFTLIAVTNGAIGVDVKPTFSWNAAIDPDGDTVSYQLLMDGDSNPTTSIVSNISETNFTIAERLPLTENLFWKVVATDTQGNTSASNTFSFTTRDLRIPATPVTANANFSGRSKHTSVVFNNKMWVIGGIGDTGRLNDVWQSTDGMTWSQVTAEASFSRRQIHTSVVFKNKMWVIGGSDVTGRLNDVWQSTDGVTWTQVTANAPFAKRSSHTSVVFDDKLWVIGGSDRVNGENIKFNDVWQSSDGINWAQVTAEAPFSKRSSHTSVVFDNKIWVIGGFDGNSDRLNDVWQSSDGMTWAQVTAEAPFSKRNLHTTVVFDDKMWVIDGLHDDDDDVWQSSDGINWAPVTSNFSFSDRYAHASVVFNNKMWVIGGHGFGAGNFLNDVWSMD